MGASTSSSSASSTAVRAVCTPSATWFISSVTSSIVMPSPILTPTVWLRLKGLMQVAMMSPIPASPANVRASPPMAMPRRLSSATPRAIVMARVLSPAPRPSAIPAAIATTFLSAPATSMPTMSSAM